MSMDRIIEMTEVEQPSDNDYVHLQSPTLGDRRIKANNLVNGSGGESIDGIYYDGTSTNLLRLWIGGQLEEDRDLEFDVTFYTPSYQSNRVIFGNTGNGYMPCCFMTDNAFRVNSGTGSQVDYVPDSFEGEHHLILNRLNDRAIVFNGDIIGAYSGVNYCLGYGTALELGRAFDISAAQFVLKEFKLTKQNNSEVVADFKAGFRALSNDYKIPCLLNTIDNTYIDLNYGRPSGNNEGHIMLCQKKTRQLDPNYNYYTYDDEKIVVRVYHEGQADEEIRWYFHNFSMPSGRQTFPTELARFYTTGANNQSAKSYTINTQNVNGWTVLGDYLGGSINEYNMSYSRVESQVFDAMVIIGDGTEQDTVYTDPYVYL